MRKTKEIEICGSYGLTSQIVHIKIEIQLVKIKDILLTHRRQM